MKKYPEYNKLDLPELDKEILSFWQENKIFEQSVSSREGNQPFTFFEGPPSANAMPGIHHVMARTLKDTFCRYKTLKGFQVKRKGGWDTHGLPIELAVEKRLGIRKEDIGTKISIEEYNKECRAQVMQFKDVWDELTQRIGYWVDLDDPYITFNNEYIETLWALLKRLYDKGLLYKGFTIQPFSPAAGTGLSSHELNQPGTYQDVKDTTIVAQFKVIREEKSEKLFAKAAGEVFFLAWTTTPWTLPSNTALAVGAGIVYYQVNTSNPYTGDPVSVFMARDLVAKNIPLQGEAEIKVGGTGKGKIGGKEIDFEIVAEFTGRDLEGIHYEQLLPYVQPDKPAFRVVIGDFVTTEDGTGIVHIAPTFGADDFRVGQQNDIPPLMVTDEDGNPGPLVDRQGKFVKEMGEFAGRYVKNYTDDPDYVSVDVDIAVKLKKENRAWKVEKYEHSYPHCWRTDKPVLYYPLDSWFIRTTAYKDRMVELNNTIRWQPAATGTGRFGNWLENLVDWNLSRSRFWGTPLPIWTNGERGEGYQELCVGSLDELKKGYAFAGDWKAAGPKEAANLLRAAIESGKSIEQLLGEGHILKLADHPELEIDLHRPFVDEVFFVQNGEVLLREPDLIDVWFDSGAMPYAQWHYPFENRDLVEEGGAFPADFIAEGVDQTRGWFFTLHALGVMLFDSVAYKSVISNGLVQDRFGKKMSKSKGNAVNPFETIEDYGVDATRWYLMGNTPPWENLKFDETGIEEVRRKFFGTLYNTYNFFALYANIDGFDYSGPSIPEEERSGLDQWILTLKNSLILKVQEAMDNLDPTRGVRAIEEFVDALSNWYVRQSRRRFWKGEMNEDKRAAYQTLYDCLLAVSKLMSPYAPFYADRLYRDLNSVSGREAFVSVHLSDWPEPGTFIDPLLEERMDMAREICSLVHSIRKNKAKINVRQPLARILIPVTGQEMEEQLERVRELILQEINVKEIEYLHPGEGSQVIEKTAKANFKVLGPKLGKNMKEAAKQIEGLGQAEIAQLEQGNSLEITVAGAPFILTAEEVEIRSNDIPGWFVASNGPITVALDVNLTDSLKNEGIARELVNRIQNIRKDSGYEVTDKISILLSDKEIWAGAVQEFSDYICTETLALKLEVDLDLVDGTPVTIGGEDGLINISKENV